METDKRRAIPLACPAFDEEMKAGDLVALRNDRFVLGENVFNFE